MMAFQNTTRVYNTEAGRNRAVGSLQKYGWQVKGKGQEVVGNQTLYTLTVDKPWASVSLILRALVAARTAFMTVMSGNLPAPNPTTTKVKAKMKVKKAA